MHSNNTGERDMSEFMEFARYWSTLTRWQKFTIYAHAMIQYRLLGVYAIFGAAFAAALFALAVSENIYLALAVGGAAGAAIARY